MYDFYDWTKWDYTGYLQSPHWKAIRAKALQRAGYRCEKCGNFGKLQVHHLSYDHIGNEQPDDLQVLCHKCHDGKRIK